MLTPRKAVAGFADSLSSQFSELSWKGRPQSLRWSCYSDRQQLRLELVDQASRIAMTASVLLPGWVCADDELVVRSAALATMLAKAGIVEDPITPLAGSEGCVLARLTSSALHAMPSDLTEVSR